MLPLRGFSLGRPLNDEMVVESKTIQPFGKTAFQPSRKGVDAPPSNFSEIYSGRATIETLPLDLELLFLMRRTGSYQISCPHQRVEYD